MLTDPRARVPGKAALYHPQTAHSAALDHMAVFAGQRYAALSVLAAAWPHGLTVAQVAKAMGMRSRNQAATRVMELREAGWVERVRNPRTGGWVTRPTGPSAQGVVHRITAAGRNEFPSIRRYDMIPVDRARLRQLLNEAPDPVKRAVAQVLTGHPPLSSDTYNDDPDLLYRITQDAVLAAKGVDYTLPFPIATDPYRQRLLALPADLRDVVTEEARTYNVPNVMHPASWEPQHAEQVDALLRSAEGTADARRKRVLATLGEAGIDDDNRHALLGQMTGGTVRSSKALTEPEAQAVADWSAQLRAGTWVMHQGQVVVAATGEFVPRWVPDWPSYAKAKGVTITHLNKLATGAAEGLGLPAVKKVTDATDPRLVAAVWRLLDVEAAITALGDAGMVGKVIDLEPSPVPEAPSGPTATAIRDMAQPSPAVVNGQQAPNGGPVVSVYGEPTIGSVVLVPVPLDRVRAVLDVLGV
jgi:hypothetical protein